MPAKLFQPSTSYRGITESLRELYLTDLRPWLVGFSGGKDSTLLAALTSTGCRPWPDPMRILCHQRDLSDAPSGNLLFCGDCEEYLDHWIGLATPPFADLVFTSPPYNLGKAYEEKLALDEYLRWQQRVIGKVLKVLKPTGSLVWQVGNFVSNGHICSLDIELAPIFKSFGLKLRNRVIWHFGHGLHCKQRFLGRYEVALWYTLSDRYTFNLDAVRIPSKYPNKKHFKGPKKGQLSGHPDGKNPEDVWTFPVWDNIPNVKSNHVEKTEHPCQFPIGLAERFILALTNTGDLVLDPLAGVASTACAAAIHARHHHSCEPDYGCRMPERNNSTSKIIARPISGPAVENPISFAA